MLKFMDSCDVEFYETIFPQKWKDKDTENTNESESEVMMPSEATVMDEAVEKKKLAEKDHVVGLCVSLEKQNEVKEKKVKRR